MKRINWLQLIASLLLLIGCIINLVEVLIEMPLWLSLLATGTLFVSVIFHIIILVKHFLNKKK